MATVDLEYNIIDGGDDVDVALYSFDTSDTVLSLSPSTIDRYIVLRFKLDDLPRGSTINSATLDLKSASSWGDDFNIKLRLENTDNSAEFDLETPESPAADRTWYTGTTWNTTTWSADADITTVDFSSQLQDIVNKAGWESGNYIAIYFDITDSSKDDDGTSFYSSEHSTEPGPILNVNATVLNLPYSGIIFDPSDSDSVTLSGSDVTNIADGNGNAADFEDGTATGPSIATMEGRDSLDFSGSESLITSDSLFDLVGGSDSSQVYAVFNLDSFDGAGRRIVDDEYGSFRLLVDWDEDLKIFQYDGTSNKLLNLGAVSLSTTYIVRVRWDGANLYGALATDVTGFGSEDSVASGGVPGYDSPSVAIGSNTGQSGNFFDGKIGIVAFNDTATIDTSFEAALIAYYFPPPTGDVAQETHRAQQAGVGEIAAPYYCAHFTRGNTESLWASNAAVPEITSGHNDFTFSVWFRPISEADMVIASTSDNATTYRWRWRLTWRSGGYVNFRHSSTGDTYSNKAITGVSLNRWNHICITFDASERLFTIWVNGSPFGTATLHSSGDLYDLGHEFTLGAIDSGGTWAFNGEMSKVAYWHNTILTDDQQIWLWNKGRGRFKNEHALESLETDFAWDLTEYSAGTSPVIRHASNPDCNLSDANTVSSLVYFNGGIGQEHTSVVQNGIGSFLHSGGISQTLEKGIQAASGSQINSGQIDQVLTSPEQSLVGKHVVQGTVQQNATTAIQSLSGASAFTGSISQITTAADQVLSGSSALSGTIDQSSSSFVQSATGVSVISGSVSQSTDPATESLSGSLATSANIAQQTAPSTQQLSGSWNFEGAIGNQSAPAEQSATGAQIFQGSIDQTTAPAEQFATADGLLSGTASQTVQAGTQSLSGKLVNIGAGEQLASACVQNVSGSLVVIGEIGSESEPAEQSLSGTQGAVVGTSEQITSAATQALTGEYVFLGQIDQAAATATQSATGSATGDGTITQNSQPSNQQAAGSLVNIGEISQDSQATTQALDGTQGAILANISQTSIAANQSLTGVQVFIGQIEESGAEATQLLEGELLIPTGDIDQTIEAPTQSAVGQILFRGAIANVTAACTQEATGLVEQLLPLGPPRHVLATRTRAYTINSIRNFVKKADLSFIETPQRDFHHEIDERDFITNVQP